jgi:hypothetical protein
MAIALILSGLDDFHGGDQDADTLAADDLPIPNQEGLRASSKSFSTTRFLRKSAWTAG